jgi:hypothetical protein
MTGLFAVTFGSPAFLDLRTRDFLSPSYGGFGFIVCAPERTLESENSQYLENAYDNCQVQKEHVVNMWRVYFGCGGTRRARA